LLVHSLASQHLGILRWRSTVRHKKIILVGIGTCYVEKVSSHDKVRRDLGLWERVKPRSNGGFSLPIVV